MALPLSMLGRYRALPSTIWVLAFANTINHLGNFVFPFLTLLLTERLGLAPARAGLFVAMATIAFVPGSLLGGKLADRIGRKRVFLAARLGFASLLLPCAFLGDSMAVPWLIVAAMIANGGVEPAVSAMASDLVGSEERPAAFSLIYLGLNLGYAIGPMVAGLLYREHAALLFAGNAVASILSALLVAWHVPETLATRADAAPAPEPLPEAERDEKGTLFSALRKRPLLVLFGLNQIAYSLVYVQSFFSLPLEMNGLFGAAGPARYGMLMTVNAVTVICFTMPSVRVSERLGRGGSIALGGLAYAFGFGSLLVARSFAAIGAATVVWSLGEILVVTNTKAFIADRAPRSHRGRLQAAIQVLSGAGYCLGPILAGPAIGHWGLSAVWQAAMVLGCAGAACTLGITRLERRRQAAQERPGIA